MVDLTAEDEGEVSEWCHVDNSITHPRRRDFGHGRQSWIVEGGGGDHDWENEDN